MKAWRNVGCFLRLTIKQMYNFKTHQKRLKGTDGLEQNESYFIFEGQVDELVRK